MTARTDYLEAALLVWRDIADQLAKAVKADPNPGSDAMAALDLHRAQVRREHLSSGATFGERLGGERVTAFPGIPAGFTRLCSACGSPDVREVERVAGIEGEAVRYTVLGCVDCGFVAEVDR